MQLKLLSFSNFFAAAISYCKTLNLINFQVIRERQQLFHERTTASKIWTKTDVEVYRSQWRENEQEKWAAVAVCKKARTNVRMEFLLFHLKHLLTTKTTTRMKILFGLFIWKLAPLKIKIFYIQVVWIWASSDRMGLGSVFEWVLQIIMRESYC